MSYLEDKRQLIVLAVTVASSISFFQGQITYLKDKGYRVAFVCSPGASLETLEGAEYYPIHMEREISIFRDLKSLIQLILLFHRLKPDIVHAGTPKAGLLAGMAAFLCRVPKRIYTCHGLRLETLSGIKRFIVKLTERVSAFCAHRVLCVSESLRSKYIDMKLANDSKTIVLHHGSCNGIDASRFQKTSENIVKGLLIRRKLGIPDNAYIIGFVGRHTKDKGIHELIEAFVQLSHADPDLYLLLCGEYEEGDPISQKVREIMVSDPKIITVGQVNDTVPYYCIMELFVLPSYREGMGNVLLEASAIELPIVSTKVTGCQDAVVDGVTGILVAPRNVRELADAIDYVRQNPAIANDMGMNGRKRVTEHFNPSDLWVAYDRLYRVMSPSIDTEMLEVTHKV